MSEANCRRCIFVPKLRTPLTSIFDINIVLFQNSQLDVYLFEFLTKTKNKKGVNFSKFRFFFSPFNLLQQVVLRYNRDMTFQKKYSIFTFIKSCVNMYTA